MATPSPDLATKTRHLRPRETVKKTTPFDSPIAAREKNTSSSMPEHEDEELSASATASHYIGITGGRLTTKRKNDALITIHNNPKRRRVVANGNGTAASAEGGDSAVEGNEDLQDVYCWECHKDCVDGAMDCVSCPRTFHPVCVYSPLAEAQKCGRKTPVPSENWTCPVCLTLTKAECSDTRSWAMQQMNIEQFCTILGFSLQRMKHSDVKTSEAFHNPVPRSLLPDYYDIIFHPMDLGRLDRNIKKKIYASTEAFLEDAKWMLHNSIIYNGANTKLTADARLILRICRHEMAEIELCPDCYLKSCIKQDDWFTDACTLPHCLVWAKLKGFPFWPAKALRISANNNVDVRFFGAHDRAWIPLNQVFLLSAECPVPIKNTKKFGLDKAVDELNLHIKRLREKFGEFNYAPSKTEFKPDDLYCCQTQFGKNIANSDWAKKLAAVSAEKRYCDPGLDDQIPAVSMKASISNADDPQSAYSMDDGHSSDNESASNDAASSTQNATLKANDTPKAHAQDDGVASKTTIDSVSSNGQSKHTSEDDSNIEKAGASKSQYQVPPLRLKVSTLLSRNDQSKEKATSSRKSTQSPDSTSPNGSGTSETSTSSSAASKTSQKKVFAPVVTLETGVPDLQINSVSSGGKRTTSSSVAPKVVASKDDDSPARKRNLQSVLEKMHSNVQQLHNHGASPSINETTAPSSKLRCDQPKASAVRQLDSRVVVSTLPNASTSSSTGPMEFPNVGEKYLQKINSFMQSTIAEMVRDIQPTASASSDFETPQDVQAQASLKALRSEYIRMQAFFNETLRAMKHAARTTFAEVQQAAESEKNKVVEEMARKHEEALNKAIAETKSKQWCASCGKEAVFYCCWNTSYCDYPCQQQHWPKHQVTCAQIRQQTVADSGTNSNQSVGSPYVPASIQYVGNSRLNSTQFANLQSQAQPANAGVVPLYTTMQQHGNLYRAATFPGGGGQGPGALNIGTLVRKR